MGKRRRSRLKIKIKRTMAFKMKGPTFFSSALKHNKGANHNKEFGQGHTWGSRSRNGVNTHEVQGPTSNQQKSQSSYEPSPTKHDLPNSEAHTHGTNKDASFDTDTKEKDFTRRDKKTYVRTKKNKKAKKTKPTDNSLIRSGNTNRRPKKKKDTWFRDSDRDGNVVTRGLGKIGRGIGKAARSIDLKGAFFFGDGSTPSPRSSSALWMKKKKY